MQTIWSAFCCKIKVGLVQSSHFVCFGCKDAMKFWCRISEFALTIENRENKCVELAPTWYFGICHGSRGCQCRRSRGFALEWWRRWSHLLSSCVAFSWISLSFWIDMIHVRGGAEALSFIVVAFFCTFCCKNSGVVWIYLSPLLTVASLLLHVAVYSLPS